MKLNFKKEKKIYYQKHDLGFGISPSKHWRILFFYGLGVLVIFLISSWYLYSRFNKTEATIVIEDQTQSSRYKKDEIYQIDEFFKKKQENFDLFKTTPPVVSDPILYK